MGPTLSPETSAFKLQTPGKFPEEYKLHSEHGESLKTTKICLFGLAFSAMTLQGSDVRSGLSVELIKLSESVILRISKAFVSNFFKNNLGRSKN